MIRFVLCLALAAAASAQAQTPSQPAVINAEEIRDKLGESYPRDLHLLGIGGTVVIRVGVTTAGAVSSVVIATSSGLPSLDQAGRSVAWQLRFAPRGDTTSVTLPFQFAPERTKQASTHVLPRLANASVVQDSAQRRAGKEAHDRKLRANVLLSVHADPNGAATRINLVQKSCINAFDNAALNAAKQLRFLPADSLREPRQTIVTFVFDVDSVRTTAAGEARDTTSEAPNTSGTGTPPRLKNQEAVTLAMQRNYPSRLRDDGIGGEVIVWVLLNEKGDIERRMIREPSGTCALDLAALETIRAARFEPAARDGKPIKVWVAIPLRFRTQ